MSDWAGAYVGQPFGDGPGELTCWSLVARVYRERLGIDLPSYGEISAADLSRVARSMNTDSGIAPWHPVVNPAAFDVALMAGPKGGRFVVHVGLVIDARRIIHAVDGCDTAIVPMAHFSIAGRLRGFRRHEALL